jgi:hypothetical protein
MPALTCRKNSGVSGKLKQILNWIRKTNLEFIEWDQILEWNTKTNLEPEELQLFCREEE